MPKKRTSLPPRTSRPPRLRRPPHADVEKALARADLVSATAFAHSLAKSETHEALETLASEVRAQRAILTRLFTATRLLCDHCDRSQHPNKVHMRALVAECRAALAFDARGELEDW